jgi:hypothetical protein
MLSAIQSLIIFDLRFLIFDLERMRVAICSSIANQKSKIKNGGRGGGVWESNPPAPALTGAQTVLKTAPLTRTDAPPLRSAGASNPKCRTRRLSSPGVLIRGGRSALSIKRALLAAASRRG